jgi:hypothetical protein
MNPSRAGLGQAPGEPVPGLGLLHADADVAGKRERGTRAREAVDLVGPDVGEEPRRVVRVGGIDRLEIAAGALGDLGGGQRRRRTLPARFDDDVRGCVAPAGVAEAIRKAVPEQVQPCAGADLRANERQAGRGGDGEEARDEPGGALRLVGLGRAVKAGEQEGSVVGERCRHRPPQRLVVGRIGRVGVGEARVALFEHQRVQRAGEAKGQGVGTVRGIPRPCQDPPGDPAVGSQAVGQQPAEPRGEWRAHVVTDLRLTAEGGAHRPLAVGSIGSHQRNRSIRRWSALRASGSGSGSSSEASAGRGSCAAVAAGFGASAFCAFFGFSRAAGRHRHGW